MKINSEKIIQQVSNLSINNLYAHNRVRTIFLQKSEEVVIPLLHYYLDLVVTNPNNIPFRFAIYSPVIQRCLQIPYN